MCMCVCVEGVPYLIKSSSQADVSSLLSPFLGGGGWDRGSQLPFTYMYTLLFLREYKIFPALLDFLYVGQAIFHSLEYKT